MLYPTLQARKGFDPNGIGPGLSAPFGYSKFYKGNHHGQDYFWLSATSAARLGMTVAQSLRVYPCVNGTIHHIYSMGLGFGLWQQIDPQHRAYWWHLASTGIPDGQYVNVNQPVGTMGHTGTAAGNQTHLHFEVRKAPYTEGSRINPAPFFNGSSSPSGGGVTPIGLFDMLSDAEQREILDKTRAIHDVLFNPNYGMKWRQLAQHYWMLGQPLPADIIAQNGLATTADSPFRQMVTDADDLPSKGELGQALTSTVALVNDHADTNKTEILDAIGTAPSGGASGGNYTLSLDIDGVPGTASGTATPA